MINYKFVIISILFIVFNLKINAQNANDSIISQKLSFGIHTSVSMSSLGGDLPTVKTKNINIVISKHKPQVWFSLGVYGEYKLKKRVSVRVGFQYVKMGGNFKKDNKIYTALGPITNTDYMNFGLNYLYMPLLIDFYIYEHYYFELGAYSTALITATKGECSIDPDAKSISYAASNDVGIVGGLGYSINKGKIGIRYSLGLVPSIVDVDGNYYQTAPSPFKRPVNTYDYYNRLLEFYLDVKINKYDK